jgi:hypothetical protein
LNHGSLTTPNDDGKKTYCRFSRSATVPATRSPARQAIERFSGRTSRSFVARRPTSIRDPRPSSRRDECSRNAERPEPPIPSDSLMCRTFTDTDEG